MDTIPGEHPLLGNARSTQNSILTPVLVQKDHSYEIRFTNKQRVFTGVKRQHGGN